MPVLQISRQPDPLAWFDAPRGQPVLTAEQDAIRHALVSRPASQPWLWLAPVAPANGPEDSGLPPRSLQIYPWGERYAGTLQCALPLPLGDESIGNVILQHALDDGREGLLEECERVLEPGGRLWLFTLNAWSPYRARWRRSGLVAQDVRGWRLRLGALGLHPCGVPVSYLGPVWRSPAPGAEGKPGPFAAACMMQLEKRTAALIPPEPLKRQWQAGAAPA